MHDENHKTRTLWLCTALHAFTHIYQVALIPLYLRIKDDFHLESEAQATFLVTILSVAYFLPSYPMGVLADRVSRKKLLGLGLAINAVGYIGLAFAPSYGMAVFWCVVAGFGGSFFHPPATSLIARLFPETTGKALGKVAIGASLGFFIGPIYAGWRSLHHDWRTPVLELGILGLIGAGLFMWLAQESSPVTPVVEKAKSAPPRKLFATRGLWFAFLMMSFFFCFRDFAGSGMVTLGSLFLQRAHHFNPWETGLTLSCIYVASMVSSPFFGKLSDGGRARWTIFLHVFAAITIVIVPRVSPEWFCVALAAYGFFFMASYPVVEAALMESVHDSVRGRIFGCFITVGGLIGNLSHWYTGEWVKRLGPKAAHPENYFGIYNLLAVFVIISLIALVFMQVIRREAKKVVDAAVTKSGVLDRETILRNPQSP